MSVGPFYLHHHVFLHLPSPQHYHPHQQVYVHCLPPYLANIIFFWGLVNCCHVHLYCLQCNYIASQSLSITLLEFGLYRHNLLTALCLHLNRILSTIVQNFCAICPWTLTKFYSSQFICARSSTQHYHKSWTSPHQTWSKMTQIATRSWTILSRLVPSQQLFYEEPQALVHFPTAPNSRDVS